MDFLSWMTLAGKQNPELIIRGPEWGRVFATNGYLVTERMIVEMQRANLRYRTAEMDSIMERMQAKYAEYCAFNTNFAGVVLPLLTNRSPSLRSLAVTALADSGARGHSVMAGLFSATGDTNAEVSAAASKALLQFNK